MNENDILYEIDEFESGKDFISLGINLAKYDIVFLDVNMDELDGMETAQKIRKVSNDVFIVFVTAFITCAPQGYSVGAIRYILKNNVNFPELIFECMDAISMNMNYVAQKKKFNFNEGAKVVVSAIPGTNGIIAPITTLSCKTGITPAAAGRLSKEISRLTYTFVKNLETLRFRHTNNASCSSALQKMHTVLPADALQT